MSPDEQAIRAVITQWARASEAFDTAALAPLMTEDVTFVVAGMPPIVGRAAFLAMQDSARGKLTMQVESDVREVIVRGDLASAMAFLRITFIAGGNAPVVRSGHTLSVFERQSDGRWMLKRDANLLVTETPKA